MKNFLINYSKEFIETGIVPVDELLINSVYYPACGIDGRPIKRLNPLFSEYGINSYVYVDYAIGNDFLAANQDTFKHYHIFATRDLKRTDLVTGEMGFAEFESIFTPEERSDYQKTLLHSPMNIKVFGKWIVYERDNDFSDEFGAKRFSLLYIGGEGAATYAALYLSRNMAPTVLVDINPGISFGGNYSSFRSVLTKIVNMGKQLPKYSFVGNSDSPSTECMLKIYEKC